MTQPDYKIFDADNHYYEAEDAFIRHIDPKMAKRCMQWCELDGRQRLLVGGKVNRFIPNPTFDPVSKPGALESYFRGRDEETDVKAAFGELEPIPAAYRDRDVRLGVMKSQGMEGAFFFPTLGVGMEESLAHDPVAAVAALRAFNRWLEEDWGFAYQEMIFGAPYVSLIDPDEAVREIEWALERDVRIVVMRSGPVAARGGAYRSPADPIYDPFWARVNEAGVTVAFHGGDSGYGRFAAEWGERAEMQAFDYRPLRIMLSPHPVHDTMAALIAHGLFARHSNLRIAAIENGSGWVHTLVKAARKTYGQMPQAFAEDPLETFYKHVWVSPFFEDDLDQLKALIPADRMMMGSDFPHAEGLAIPADWAKDIQSFPADEQRLVMRENALALSRRRPASAA